MTHVMHRTMASVPRTAVHSDGMWITDATGKTYLDACGGAAVASIGHGDPRVLEAMRLQLEQLAYAHTSFFTTEVAENLAEFLTHQCPGNMTHVYFTSGGSEAVESALKLARQYFVEIDQPARRRFIGRRQSYHGNTLGALSVGGNLSRRKIYDPLLMESHHVSACYPYRGMNDGESEEQYTTRLLAELEDTIQELGPETVAGFVAETVVGATLGAVEPTRGYFKGIRDICDRHGILLILDEVMCGMGRTGTLFAFDQEGIEADLVTIAKGLGGGYAPIGGLVISKPISEAIRHGSGAFMHGHTYNGHPLACAAALAVQHVIQSDRLLDNVKSQGSYLIGSLRERLAHHPAVGDVRGRGLFVGIEFVCDRSTKKPFPSELRFHSRVRSAALSRGLAIYDMGGTIDGQTGDHLLVAPPYTVSQQDIDLIVERLCDSIDQATAEASASVG